jgi:hypothetical protein
MSSQIHSAGDALNFVNERGLVLASAKGPVPRLIDAIAGETIQGNWWVHPNARAIYRVLSEVTRSDDVLVCRLIDDKITLVHRRLWPPLVRLAAGFSPRRVAMVQEQHTARGHHQSREIPFPDWVPPEVARQAQELQEHEAVAMLSPWLPLIASPRSNQ